MLRTVKPKTARSKRALDKKAPKATENAKKALFVPGSTSNKFLHDVMVDLEGLKKPYSVRFQRKNEVRPFEDASTLEFFSEKNDTSLLVLSTHNKKRPNCLTFARTFNYQIYDMIELLIVNGKLMQDFAKQTFNVGMKPMIVFNGALFDEHPVYQHIKSLFTDFFRNEETSLLDPAGLQHVIIVSAGAAEGADVPEDAPAGSPLLPQVHFRVYLLKTEPSTTPKMPRVELDEVGPRLDFAIGREQRANPDMEKQAFKRGKQVEKTKKNIEMDSMGDQLGRIHVGKQDLSQLQTRKMKGLKRQFDQVSDDDEEVDGSEEEESEDDDDDDVEIDGDSEGEDDGDFGGFSD